MSVASSQCRPMQGSRSMMLKSEAEQEAIRRWRELPRHERKTPDQAAAFAHTLMADIEFETSADRYAFIKRWLQRDLSVRGGL